jgi:hypothetical protein
LRRARGEQEGDQAEAFEDEVAAVVTSTPRPDLVSGISRVSRVNMVSRVSRVSKVSRIRVSRIRRVRSNSFQLLLVMQIFRW